MNADYFRQLIEYTYWGHHQVWSYVLALSDEQYHRPCDYSVGSVHEQVVHTMGAELIWLQRVRGDSPGAFLNAADFADRSAVQERWNEIEMGWQAFAAGLSDEALKQPISYVSIKGNSRREHPLWEALTQVTNHATDHRAQILFLIHQLGGKTGAQDFIFYMWGNPGG